MIRRHVVEGLLLAAAVGGKVLAPACAAAGVAPAAEPRMGRNILVWDTRFEAARRYWGAAPRGGWTVIRFSGDVTPLWHQLLDTQWHRHAVAMHGMTRPNAFLCLQQLVADRFWRATSIEPAGELIQWALAPRSFQS